MIFDNWNISGCVKLRMLDNKTSSFDVVGNIPDGWEWQLLYSCNGNLNIVEMQHEENILSVIFTKEMLPTDGTYLFQLKATKDDLVKHTNIVKSYVNKSLSGDIKWPVIPTEFTQIEQVVKGYAESAKESSIKAENAAVHSPIVGENGNWFIWDFTKSEYVDSGKPASIGGGTDLSLGLTAATVGQTVKVKAVDADGKPTEWEPVDMAGGDLYWIEVADITTEEQTQKLTISADKDGRPISQYNALVMIFSILFPADATQTSANGSPWIYPFPKIGDYTYRYIASVPAWKTIDRTLTYALAGLPRVPWSSATSVQMTFGTADPNGDADFMSGLCIYVNQSGDHIPAGTRVRIAVLSKGVTA